LGAQRTFWSLLPPLTFLATIRHQTKNQNSVLDLLRALQAR
jgi:hypothetical protein